MEPVAIVGIGCRFPGAESPQAFWELLREGENAVTEVPRDRWDVETFYAPQPATPGKMNTRYGGFIRAIDQFDPSFYGISPREAERMDPQQRLVLEVAWEALENAGIVPAALSGSQTSVFIGCGNFDYGILLSKEPERISAYDGTGSTIGISANRLSYLLNLRGPSLAIETACSSSLVALHLACRSLQAGESEVAIVGAVSLMLTPEQTITYSQARMMAADGRCKTFDAGADGYVRGEGCGIVVIKRLSDAVQDGDRIQAIVRGTAVNQDGLSNGLTAPNGPSQQAVILQALQTAEVEPAQISYIEAHGTGTSLGDPIEIRSLKSVLMQGRRFDQPCWIGSVKTNIGHLEAAAGMAGLIKVVLALQHQQIPPHLHLDQLNPLISFDKTPFAIPTTLQPWTSTGVRLAGISSFGFGGTNAHVVLEEPPSPCLTAEVADRPFHLLTLSAKTEPALQELAQRYAGFLAKHPECSLGDLCFTANTGRSPFEYRLAVTADCQSEMQQHLASFAQAEPSASWVSGQVKSRKSPKMACLFTGQGSQYVNMGRSLYETQPVFHQVLTDCAVLLQPYLEHPLLEILYPNSDTCENEIRSLLDNTAYTQPALFALEYALYKLWQSWGIQPSVVLGHSVGEYVAACVAGVFSLEDGLKLIAERGRLMQALPADGAMVAVMAPIEQVMEWVESKQGVAIAAINGPHSVVISGERRAIDTISEQLVAVGAKTKALAVSHAFHSPLMQPMVQEFYNVAQTVSYSTPTVDFISNLTGQSVTDEVANPDYWCQHILQPVRFREGIQALAQRASVLLEVGPKPVLLGMGRQCLDTATADALAWLPSLRAGQSDWQSLLQSLGAMVVRGVTVDWQGVEQGYSRHRVAVPTYPFQRQRYWMTSATNDQQPIAQVTVPNAAIPSTQVIELLTQGDTDQLAQQLATQLSAEEGKYLPKFLDVLVQQHQQAIAATKVQNWLYQVEWQLRTEPRLANATSNSSSGHWLIFADETRVGQALADKLRQQGQICSLVYRGEFYQQRAEGIWCIHPTDSQGYNQLLQAVSFHPVALTTIVHLWNLDAPPSETLTLTELEQAQTWGCSSVLPLLDSLRQQSASPQLWLVTRSATPAAGSQPAITQSPVWGLGKVVSLEYPEYWGGLVDLAPEPSAGEAGELLKAIAQAEGEDQIALRAGRCYVARLLPVRSPTIQSNDSHIGVAADGTYLITGGLGALGLRLAQWLVTQGARHLALLGRREASLEAQKTITQLEEVGVQVLVAQADVANQADMTQVLATVAAKLPPLRGVIHAAGVVGYQTLQELDVASFEGVLRPKVLGGWVLHRLTQEMPLDFFVGFSSIASVWGSKGQAHYAAANQFLDALAQYRQHAGLPGLSVNWGPWAGGGMASEEAQQWLARMGVNLLPPESALTALGMVLTVNRPQTVIADVDWVRFKGLYEARVRRPLLQYWESPPDTATTPTVGKSTLLQQLEMAAESDRPTLLIACLQMEVAQVLGLADSQLPEPQRGFFELGMDSLMAVELRARLEKSFNASLPATLAFEAPTIHDLAAFLSREVLGWTAAEVSSPEVADSTIQQTVEGGFEGDWEVAVAERLAKLEHLVRALS